MLCGDGPRSGRVDGLGEFHVAPQAVAVAADIDDVAAVEQPVEQCIGWAFLKGLRPTASA